MLTSNANIDLHTAAPPADAVTQKVSAEQFDYEITGSVVSDAGCVRESNEDSGRLVIPRAAGQLAGKGLLAVVADGMGGHSAGEVASRIAVEIISTAYYQSEEEPNAALPAAFREANQHIFEQAQTDPRLAGMGTTGTALALCGGLAFCAHVGDSRLYLIRNGAIYLMSEDHSAVMELVRKGQLSLAAAGRHPDKNVLLRALGTRPEVEVMSWDAPFPVRAGDQFVLCSDGLYDLVADNEIQRAAEIADTYSACESLIALAKERGGHDNITIGILRLQSKSLNRDTSVKVKETRDLEVVK